MILFTSKITYWASFILSYIGESYTPILEYWNQFCPVCAIGRKCSLKTSHLPLLLLHPRKKSAHCLNEKWSESKVLSWPSKLGLHHFAEKNCFSSDLLRASRNAYFRKSVLCRPFSTSIYQKWHFSLLVNRVIHNQRRPLSYWWRERHLMTSFMDDPYALK